MLHSEKKEEVGSTDDDTELSYGDLKSRYQETVNQGCIYFQQRNLQMALSKFKSAFSDLEKLTIKSEAETDEQLSANQLLYNLALTYFEM